MSRSAERLLGPLGQLPSAIGNYRRSAIAVRLGHLPFAIGHLNLGWPSANNRSIPEAQPITQGTSRMAKYEHFEDLPVWQEAKHLYNTVLDLLEEPSLPLTPAFRNQLDRAALSVSNNIAEG